MCSVQAHYRPGHTMTSSLPAPIILNRVLCNPKMNRQVPGAGGGPCTLLPKNPLLQQNTGLVPHVVQSNLSHSLSSHYLMILTPATRLASHAFISIGRSE